MSALPQPVGSTFELPPRILIVHNDARWRLDVAQALRATGLAVTCLAQTDECLALIDDLRPDCLVVDSGLPASSAEDICRKVRAHPRHAELPILWLASQLDSHALAQAERCAASDLDLRMLEAPVLLHRIRLLLKTQTGNPAQPVAGGAMRRDDRHAARFEWFPRTAEVRGSEAFFRLLDRPMAGPMGESSDPIAQSTLLSLLSARDGRRLVVALAGLLNAGSSRIPEIDLQTRSSGRRRIRIEVTQVRHPADDHPIVSGQVMDVTPAADTAIRLYRLTRYEALTGLPNRQWLQDALATGVQSGSGRVALALLEIDRFSEVTEAYGQPNADRLVVELAQRLERLIRVEGRRRLSTTNLPAGTPSKGRIAEVAHLGGNDFALLLDGLDTSAEALSLSRRVMSVFSEPFRLDDRELFLRASMGVHLEDAPSQCPRGEEALAWMGRAELARRAAAVAGGHQIRLYEPSESDQWADRLVMERDLHYAIVHDELEMHLQPKVQAASGHIVGFEALMRWRRHGQLQSAGRFIPLAEEMGLIVPLGEWAIDRACALIARIRDAGRPDCTVAVNLSARQLIGPRLASVVADALRRHAVSPQQLELELTESALMQDPDQALQELRAIRALGVGLAVDDFGTGYSSLAYLTRLPLSTLKIDRTFVQDLEVSERSRAVAAAVLTLGANLNLNVVAEGVEREAQREALLQMGCAIQQGFLYGPALPAQQALHRLAATSAG